MRVLVTRPLDDARQTAQELARRGHEALIAPLFSIRFLDTNFPSGVPQAILVTSANGIRALARRSAPQDMPLFAVGPHTAGVARSFGFTDVIDAKGDWKALAFEARARLRPDAGYLLVIAGADASSDLSHSMERAGFRVQSHVAYETVAAPVLPGAACEALRSDNLDATVLYSTRSAALLSHRVQEAQLAAACGRLIACCISESTARALHEIAFGEVRVAKRPDQDALLALLGSDLPSHPHPA